MPAQFSKKGVNPFECRFHRTHNRLRQEVLEMFLLDAISAIEFGDGELRIDFADGAVDRYRVRDGQVEFFSCRSQHPIWCPLSPEELLQHVVLHTPVATWLRL